MHPARALLILLALTLLPLAHANAANNRTRGPGGFSAQISGSQTLSYDSNPLRITDGSEQAIFGSTTSPRLIVRKSTPLSTIESDTRVDVNLFDQAEYNSTDLHQKLTLKTQNQRWTAGLNAGIDYDTTRTSELTNYALKYPKVHRTKLTAAPHVTFRPNTHDSISLAASATTATYSNNAYIDYAAYSLTPSYAHRFDPYNTATLSFVAQRYESTSGAKQSSNSFGPTLGWSSSITPRLTTHVSAGAQSTHKTGSNAANDDDMWNYIYSGKLIYKGERDTIDFTATRAREPFGNGTETLLTTVALKAQHSINPKLTAKAAAKYQTADYESAPGVNLDKGWNAGTGLSYQLRENLTLDADYTYRREKLTTISTDTDQHIVMFSMTYQPS